MSEQQLIDAIAASPDDPLPRLIYADWLEEHGSPWADVWRSGDFCEAMGWHPEMAGYCPAWFKYRPKFGEFHQYEQHRLPENIFRQIDPHDPLWIDCNTAEEATETANRAFMLAWCEGWRPTQSDCRGGVRLVETETETEIEA